MFFVSLIFNKCLFFIVHDWILYGQTLVYIYDIIIYVCVGGGLYMKYRVGQK